MGSIVRRHFHNMATNLIGHFQLLGMEHRLVAGIELRQDKVQPSQTVLRAAPNLDIFAPDYSQSLGEITGISWQKSDSKMVGTYLQDMISL